MSTVLHSAHKLHVCIMNNIILLGRDNSAQMYILRSSGINGTQIFACYCDRVLGHRYLLWLKIFAVPFLPLDPYSLLPNASYLE